VLDVRPGVTHYPREREPPFGAARTALAVTS